MRRAIVAAIAAGLALVGCSSDDAFESAPAAEPAAPVEAPVSEAEPEVGDRETFELAMEMTLAEMLPSEIVMVCDGVDTFGVDFVVDGIREGFDSSPGEFVFYPDIAESVLLDMCEGF